EDPEDLELLVRISAKGRDSVEEDYDLDIKMQREDYELDLLSIEAPETANAGSVIAVDVVLKNIGSNRLDDTYVKVSISDVVERIVYFGDIAEIVDDNYDFIRDTINKRIYLSIPNEVITGVYDLEVEAYNYDAEEIAKKQVFISGIEPTDEEDEDVEVIDGEVEEDNTVLILTVILAIIFVVLLIVLIVLLTKKPAETEEFGETSYY
ncbi:unnamed protein product, partial [marine sediment metagenome]